MTLSGHFLLKEVDILQKSGHYMIKKCMFLNISIIWYLVQFLYMPPLFWYLTKRFVPG